MPLGTTPLTWSYMLGGGLVCVRISVQGIGAPKFVCRSPVLMLTCWHAPYLASFSPLPPRSSRTRIRHVLSFLAGCTHCSWVTRSSQSCVGRQPVLLRDLYAVLRKAISLFSSICFLHRFLVSVCHCRPLWLSRVLVSIFLLLSSPWLLLELPELPSGLSVSLCLPAHRLFHSPRCRNVMVSIEPWLFIAFPLVSSWSI